MSPKSKKPKSALASLEREINLAAHRQDSGQGADLTTWTAYGNIAPDPLAELAGRPIEVLRVYRLTQATALQALKSLPKLRALHFQGCELDVAQLLAAARALPTLEVLKIEGSKGKVEAADVSGLGQVRALHLQGATLADEAIAALFAVKTREEVVLQRGGSDSQKQVVVKDQPVLRHLNLDLTVKSLTLIDLPALTELELGGSFDELKVEDVPLVSQLELPIGDRASIKNVGVTKIIGVGLSSFELKAAPNLKTLDLRDSEETLDPKRLAALRKAFPRATVLPR